MPRTNALSIYSVGAPDPGAIPDQPCVVLIGSVDAIRQAARLFGEDVVLTLASDAARQAPRRCADATGG